LVLGFRFGSPPAIRSQISVAGLAEAAAVFGESASGPGHPGRRCGRRLAGRSEQGDEDQARAISSRRIEHPIPGVIPAGAVGVPGPEPGRLRRVARGGAFFPVGVVGQVVHEKGSGSDERHITPKDIPELGSSSMLNCRRRRPGGEALGAGELAALSGPLIEHGAEFKQAEGLLATAESDLTEKNGRTHLQADGDGGAASNGKLRISPTSRPDDVQESRKSVSARPLRRHKEAQGEAAPATSNRTSIGDPIRPETEAW